MNNTNKVSSAFSDGTNILNRFDTNVAEKSPEEWAKEFVIDEYAPNNEIAGEYDKSLAAKCENGIFVGKKTDGVIEWKGIPFSVQPVGDRRFCQAADPEPSDRVFEAYHFGPSCPQRHETSENAAGYYQSEDCLKLNVWANTGNISDKKPVVVYIHGGGFESDGTSNPVYDGYNFSYCNPEVILVTVTYRLGVFGCVNLSCFDDGDKYETSVNNYLLDQVQALRWISKNIAAFGGDADNVTVIGQSAGAISASCLATLPEAKGLFRRMMCMSGGVSNSSKIEDTYISGELLCEHYKTDKVSDIQKIPADELYDFYSVNHIKMHCFAVRGGGSVPADPYVEWEAGATRDITILQGRTADEYGYFRNISDHNSLRIYNAFCFATYHYIQDKVGEKYREDEKQYFEILKKLGYKNEELIGEYANDKFFNSANGYQATLHARSGGKGYYYIFEAEYDYPENAGAGHAIDCYFLFGNFDGKQVRGTVDQQKLSRWYQKFVVNYASTGNPSMEGLEWPEYNNETRPMMMIGVNNVRVENNPEKERKDIVIQMCMDEAEYRYNVPVDKCVASLSGLK